MSSKGCNTVIRRISSAFLHPADLAVLRQIQHNQVTQSQSLQHAFDIYQQQFVTKALAKRGIVIDLNSSYFWDIKAFSKIVLEVKCSTNKITFYEVNKPEPIDLNSNGGSQYLKKK
jgi:hypothetical protein